MSSKVSDGGIGGALAGATLGDVVDLSRDKSIMDGVLAATSRCGCCARFAKLSLLYGTGGFGGDGLPLCDCCFSLIDLFGWARERS